MGKVKKKRKVTKAKPKVVKKITKKQKPKYETQRHFNATIPRTMLSKKAGTRKKTVSFGNGVMLHIKLKPRSKAK